MRFICHRLRAAIFSHLAPLNGLAREAAAEITAGLRVFHQLHEEFYVVCVWVA
jgi:hypothetical protein